VPVPWFTGLLFEQGREQVELLLEQRLILTELVSRTMERISVEKEPRPKNNLGATARTPRRGRRKTAENTLIGSSEAEHRDRRAQAYAFWLRPADCGEHHFRRGTPQKSAR